MRFRSSNHSRGCVHSYGDHHPLTWMTHVGSIHTFPVENNFCTCWHACALAGWSRQPNMESKRWIKRSIYVNKARSGIFRRPWETSARVCWMLVEKKILSRHYGFDFTAARCRLAGCTMRQLTQYVGGNQSPYTNLCWCASLPSSKGFFPFCLSYINNSTLTPTEQ